MTDDTGIGRVTPETSIERLLEEALQEIEMRPRFREAMYERARAAAFPEAASRDAGAERAPVRLLVRGKFARRRPAPFVLAAAASIALVAVIVGGIPRPPSAVAVIMAAQERFASVPAFHLTMEGTIAGEVLAEEQRTPQAPDVRYRWSVHFDGDRAWRLDVLAQDPPGILAGSPGSFRVWDGERIGFYLADTKAWWLQEDAGEFEPLGELSWDAADGRWEELCASGSVEGREELAGRLTERLRCGQERLWVDSETGLILRRESEGFHARVVEVELQPAVDPAMFEVTPPAEATDAGAQPSPEPVPGPEVGSTPVDWAATTLDGGHVRLSELRGRPVLVYVWADWCDQACFRSFQALEEVADAQAPWLDVLTIDLDGSFDGARDAVSRHRITLPVVVDDGTIANAWDLHMVPAWYVLDADGVVRASRLGPLDRASIADLLATVSPGDAR